MKKDQEGLGPEFCPSLSNFVQILGPKKSEAIIKDVKRRTKRLFNPEEKIAIVLEGLSGDESVAAICRREGIAQSVYYSWSNAFMDAGKARLNGDTKREVKAHLN